VAAEAAREDQAPHGRMLPNDRIVIRRHLIEARPALDLR
jgi:hypothetical protein